MKFILTILLTAMLSFMTIQAPVAKFEYQKNVQLFEQETGEKVLLPNYRNNNTLGKEELIKVLHSSMKVVNLHRNSQIDINQDSEQLKLQDMLMMFLIPYINEDVGTMYYPHILNMKPLIEGWKIDIIKTERVNGFRGFIFEITLEVEPTIDHHVPVGKDRLIYQISYGPDVKLISNKHLETYKLPDDLKQFQAKSDINDKVIIQYYRLDHFY